MVRSGPFRHRRRPRPQTAFGALATRRAGVAALGDLDARRSRQPENAPFFRAARKKQDRVPRDVSNTRFEIPDLEEIAGTLSEEPAS